MSIEAMTISDFRRRVRDRYPHITMKVRTVSFQDLARASAKVLTVDGDRSYAEIAQVNEWAEAAGIVPDRSIRFF